MICAVFIEVLGIPIFIGFARIELIPSYDWLSQPETIARILAANGDWNRLAYPYTADVWQMIARKMR